MENRTLEVTDTWIDITDLRIFARHGVMEQERTVGNEFSVTMRLYYDASRAMLTDDVAEALSYAEVIEVIKEEMAVSSALLENAAMRLAAALTETFPQLTAGQLTLTKLKPPVPAQLSGASFTLSFSVH